MTAYRIYTEDKGELALLARRVSQSFDGFTFIPAYGYWKGQPERSVIIEIVTDQHDAIIRLTEWIRTTYQQETVLVTSSPVVVTLITSIAA